MTWHPDTGALYNINNTCNTVSRLQLSDLRHGSAVTGKRKDLWIRKKTTYGSVC